MNTIKTVQASCKAIVSLLLIVSLSLLTSCSKSDSVDKPDTGNAADTTEGGVPYYKVQRVSNVPAQVTNDDPTAATSVTYYSLEYNKVQPASYQQTSYWDLTFSGIEYAYFGGNNKSNSTNPGYGGPGIGGITIVEKAFDDVTDGPHDSQFNTGTGVIGLDESGAFGQGLGWCLYDFGGTTVSNGTADKQHVVYALGDSLPLSNGTTLSPRTVILRTANGDFAKIKMLSAYKDILDRDSMHTNSPHMYFTFDFVLVPAGSTKFTVKQ